MNGASQRCQIGVNKAKCQTKTHNKTNMNVLPYRYPKTNSYYNRLIVEPVKLPEQVTEDGLVVPARELPGSQLGKVYASCKGSDFKAGDEVQYLKVDRAKNEGIDTISIEGKTYDCVYEHKIWAHNDKPYNQVLVRPVSDGSVSESGLVIPGELTSVTRKGVVYNAPEFMNIKKGDRVEYQNQPGGFYPQASIDGEQYDVIFEADIFLINDKVAPHRIIIKIDLVAQHLKRSSTHSGLVLSPLFIHMLRNLQYAEIDAIGEEAKKKYPELETGDTIVIDHGVESQDYRIVKYEYGENKNPLFEYRILNCYDFSDREIFGKLVFKKKPVFDKKSHQLSVKPTFHIIPMCGSLFMKWDINLFHGKNENTQSSLIASDDDLSNYHDIDTLRRVVATKRKDAAEKAKLKVSGIKRTLTYVQKDLEPERHKLLSAECAAIEQEEGRISVELRKDYWVVCDSVFPLQTPRYIISPYEELYPINILGTKYLIGHEDFLLFKSHTNMNIKSKDLVALSDNVLILPIEDKQGESELFIPDAARQKPQYGTVVKIGDNNDGVKPGDFVMFRQNAGLLQEIDGVEHRVMKQNDLLMVEPSRDKK